MILVNANWLFTLEISLNYYAMTFVYTSNKIAAIWSCVHLNIENSCLHENDKARKNKYENKKYNISTYILCYSVQL